MADVVFGNPWHGRLAAGTIELETGTPVDSITIDGTEYDVKTVSGVLGDTRFYCAPPYPSTDPETPDEVAENNGTFKRDMILYSDSFRWSPLSDKSILDDYYHWLLWDSTAGAWRNMRISVDWSTLSTNPVYPSSDNSTSATVLIQRGGIFGRIDHNIEDTPDTPQSWSTVGTVYIPYKYIYNNIPGFSVYSPVSRSLMLDARRDGLRILLGIYSSNDWALEVNVGLRDVYEIILADGGTSVVSSSQVSPPTETPTPSSPNLFRHVSDGTPYYVDEGFSWNWFLPTEIEQRYTTISCYGGYCVSGYDKNGVAKLMYFWKQSTRFSDRLVSGDFFIGDTPPDDPAPDYDVGPTSWSPLIDFVGKPWLVGTEPNYSAGDFVNTDSAELMIKDELGEIVETIEVDYDDGESGPYIPERITNNVASVNKDDVSFMRAAPGSADYSLIALPVFATFDHRSASIMSSADAVGVI